MEHTNTRTVRKHGVDGIGPGRWNAGKLAEQQERHADRIRPLLAQPYVYRLYTETVPDMDLEPIIARYFSGYTVYSAVGVFEHARENSTVIEIVAPAADMQKVVDLAGDIRVANLQSVVLLTWSTVSTLAVSDDSVNAAQVR